MQPARSLAQDETAAAHPDTNASGGRELRAGTYEEYDCDGCLAFFEGAQQYSADDQIIFCQSVSYGTGKLGFGTRERIAILAACDQLFECARTQKNCCQSLGGACLN